MGLKPYRPKTHPSPHPRCREVEFDLFEQGEFRGQAHLGEVDFDFGHRCGESVVIWEREIPCADGVVPSSRDWAK